MHDSVTPSRQRPAAGTVPGALGDHDLLAFVLGRGRTNRDVGERARRLLDDRGLEAWARLSADRCRGEARRALGGESTVADRDAGVVAALFELARRSLGPPPGVELSRPEDVAPLLLEWRLAQREHFVGFYLNARNQLLVRALVSVGSLSASIVHPREVFRPALEVAAAGVIVAHNHPSGDPEPSPEDLAVTRRLAEAGSLLGIELLDHVIVAARGHVSLKARGHL